MKTTFLLFLFCSFLVFSQFLEVDSNQILTDSSTFDLTDTIKSAESPPAKIIDSDSTQAQSEKNTIQDSYFEDYGFEDLFNRINFWDIFRLILIVIVFSTVLKLLNVIQKDKNQNRGKQFSRKVFTVFKASTWVIFLSLIYLNIFGKSEIVPLIIFSTLLITSLFALIPFFKNILGRFLISSSNLFNEGDFIQISGYQGNVVAIRWFTTEITNELGYTVYLPNSIYLINPLENVNLGKKEEVVSLEFELPLDINPEIAKEIIKDAALSNFLLYIHKEPEIFIKNVSYTENIYRLKLNITLFDSKYESLLIDQLNKTVMDFLITNRKQEN